MTLLSRLVARRSLLSVSIALVGLTLSAATAELSTLTPIIVNTILDTKSNDGFCSLREAVTASNSDSASGSKPGECAAGSGEDWIEIPAGTYTLTRSDSGKEDSSSTGDLDLKGSVRIAARPGERVVIGASAFTDRIFHVLSGSSTLEGLMIQGGRPVADGGAILNLATLTVLNSTLSDNSTGGSGGGIANQGSLTLANVTISGNQAKNHGGGLFNSAGQSVLNNVTITGNTADSDNSNGGDGGGVARTSGTVTAGNSIIAGNVDKTTSTQRPDCSGSLASNGHNLIQSTSGCAITGVTTGNLTNQNPMLGTLADNGGTTFTHALLSGSPAIDAANPATPGSGGFACESTDQRGALRPRGIFCDIGAYEAGLPNPPVLIRAFGNQVDGLLVGPTGTTFTFLSGDTCDSARTGGLLLLTTSVTPDENGYFRVTLGSPVVNGQFLVATATDPNREVSAPSACIVAGPGNDSWPRALPLTQLFAGIPLSVEYSQILDTFGQSLWYKFTVEPGSVIIITLTDLQENYDLTVYKNIADAYQQLLSGGDLERLGAEFAPSAFSPSAFSPSAFSPSAFSPSAFSPSAFSPSAFSPSAFSPSAFSPSAFSPDAWSPSAFSPSAFSPSAFSPSAFSPSAFSPSAFSPSAFSAAQMQSLIGVSAFDGTAGEGLVLNTWNNTGDFYVRVRGREGAFSLDAPFTLGIVMFPGSCSKVSDSLPSTTHTSVPDVFKTIILTDMNRMEGTALEKTTLAESLDALKNRPEVDGVIVDVGADARVFAANSQADAHQDCPYAKNLVADAARRIVDLYRPNGIQYVVIVGNDDVIPFFRHPDEANLGPEQQYVPPVLDSSASQASLRLNFVLSQEDYGAEFSVSFGSDLIPIPDLAVGRLVETAAEVTGMLDAYLATTGGVVPAPFSSLVTGYDFLEDAANAIHQEFLAGIGGSANETLIAPNNISPEDPASWTADQLSAAFLGSRHDLIFLAGHFSANSALAADYRTSLITTDLLASPVDLTNSIIFSAGCHSGYNIVNAHGVPLVTFEPDWAQAFARKGATFIGGTGYQYGDTEFIEYSERLYLEFARQLRAGAGPVAVGDALVAAKQAYLASTPAMRGIHAKAFLEATLFGLPMLSVDMPGARFNPPGQAPVVTSTNPFTANPGAALGLTYADLTVTPVFIEHTLPLENYDTDPPSTVEAFYLSGANGILTNPVEPTLPLELRNVTVASTFLRGVGVRGGSYTDRQNILALTGAPTTEIRGVAAPFQTPIYYPVRPWSVNYFDRLVGESGGITQLAVTPAQFKSSATNPERGTLRQFNSINFRLYYSSNISSFDGGSSTPALAAPPTIVRVSSGVSGASVTFSVNVVGNPAAGIQEVWVTYTDVSNPGGGTWQSVDLIQNAADSTLWEGSLSLANPANTRFIVQAVDGLGLVTMATNMGNYYTPGFAGAGQPSTLAHSPSNPATGKFGTTATFSAVLTSGSGPVSGEVVTFFLGPLGRVAVTNGGGQATVELPILALPGDNEVTAFFAGNANLAPSGASSPFDITKRDTQIELQANDGFPEADVLISVVLSEANPSGRRLAEQTVVFVVSGVGGSHTATVITDYLGRATLGELPLRHGGYTVNAYFSGTVPGQPITHEDARYNPSTASAPLTLFNHVPVALADAYVTPEDTPLLINAPGLLVNDTDADGDPLTAVLVVGSGPTNGTLLLNADGSFTYTPAPNFNGADAFNYVANDGSDNSLPVTVAITVNPVNDAPVASDDVYATHENTALSVPAPGVLGNDSDVDNVALTTVLVSGPTKGTLSLNANGSFTYTPNLNFFGADSFSYRVSDGVLFSNVATVTLTVNGAPTCGTAFASSTTLWPPDGTFYPVSILGVTDPEGGLVTIVITEVWQDEPVGDDIDAAIQTPPDTVLLRAERAGTGDGRVYHIYFTATDGSGATCGIARGDPPVKGIRVLAAPHDQGGNVDSVDGGPLFRSTELAPG